eukprot:1139512-Pelagomonas_calceolata.AAC.4
MRGPQRGMMQGMVQFMVQEGIVADHDAKRCRGAGHGVGLGKPPRTCLCTQACTDHGAGHGAKKVVVLTDSSASYV